MEEIEQAVTLINYTFITAKNLNNRRTYSDLLITKTNCFVSSWTVLYCHAAEGCTDNRKVFSNLFANLLIG